MENKYTVLDVTKGYLDEKNTTSDFNLENATFYTKNELDLLNIKKDDSNYIITKYTPFQQKSIKFDMKTPKIELNVDGISENTTLQQ